MTYAILRTKKIKCLSAVTRSARHTFREQPTPNADPARFGRNRTVGAGSTEQLIESLRARLPAKRRKDAVLCIEYLVTASPEAFQCHGGRLDDLGGAYFADALTWLRKRHGSDNVISSTIHLDESTPHLVAYVIPRTKDGRLSCRDFLGSPAKLREMQDGFHAACGAKRGLERGVKGSKAKHEDVKAFYSTLTAANEAPQLSRKDYAAAAFGVKTENWKYAEKVASANALRATYEPRTRKATRSKCKVLKKLAVTLLEQQQIAAHREIERTIKEDDLEQRFKSLVSLEKISREAECKVLSLEAERDALQRQLEILEEKKKQNNKAPERGHRDEIEYTLG
ncbi:MobV family relaxase [Pseudomonas fluorescens]|uniref:Plasmid recombination enzyme n=1 Tax=Pseudomonas fluorescens TaxID=294 RepID=A0A5E7EV87_PSEFL|nr:MobV family relaxase [Pseudomonas fluorescens]VVO30860.1 hypothetical protein PS710_05012 [Pseudomonas fluorescens]